MNNEAYLSGVADKILSKVKPQDSENHGFVITTLMIISIVLTLIRVIQECNKSKIQNFSQTEKCDYFGDQIKEKTIKRSWFTKMVVKKSIRKELPTDAYKEYGISLMNSILDTGENLSNNEISALVEAANV